MKRTITFRELLFAVASACGINTSTLATEDDENVRQLLVDGINEAYEFAFTFRDWPEALELEELTVEQDEAADLPYLPRQLADGTVLHTVHGIWTAHPADPDTRSLPYDLQPLGYYLRARDTAEDEEVWVKYRPDTPVFSAALYDADTAYSEGDLVYHHTSGQCYKALDDLAAGVAVTVEASWQVVPVLRVLKQAVVQGARAHYLRSQGQDKTGTATEQRMWQRLEEEVLRMDSAEGQKETYHSTR
jgi:hypothetical protein